MKSNEDLRWRKAISYVLAVSGRRPDNRFAFPGDRISDGGLRGRKHRTGRTAETTGLSQADLRPSMSAISRVARLSDRIFDRLRHQRAFTVTEDDAVDGDFVSIRNHKYAVLVTFRSNGEPVPSPVWFGVDEQGRAYLKTASHAGKIKRLRRDNRVLITPSNMRGKPTGRPMRGVGRVLPKPEWQRAEKTLAARYGAGRRISERVLGAEDTAAYIEITPRRTPRS